LTALTHDVVVIGGGIVGCACAEAFARRGLRTGLVESGPIGGGATAAGMGHLVVMDDSEAQFSLTRHSQLLWNALAEELPPSAEFDRCGTLWIATDEDEMREVRRRYDAYVQRDVPVALLDDRALAEAEPNLRPGLPGALLVAEDGVIYPPAAAAHLARRAIGRGTALYLGERAVRVDAGRVTLENGIQLGAEAIVVATGRWTNELCPGVEIRPRKGHLLITDRHPGFARHQLIELGYLQSAHGAEQESIAFNVQPRRTGQVLLGSTRQFGAEDVRVDAQIVSRMVQRALEYMPRFGRLSAIRIWTGQRAATADNLPLIGPSPHVDKVWLATGHEGLGITTSLGTAQLLSQQLLGERTEIPPEPFLPARFRDGMGHG
jgi:glycine/D-amino acid oxidase-like deaminating enzyme